MYSSLPGLVLGFHGCDEEVAEKVLSGRDRLLSSVNEYDWLGHGIYFWENNPIRAHEYAEIMGKHPERVKHPIRKPAAVGAIIDLGNCLNLLESKSVDILIQICIRNPNCIKGYFRVLKPVENYSVP